MHYAKRTIIIALGKGYQVFKFSPEGKVLMTLGKAGVASAEPSSSAHTDCRMHLATYDLHVLVSLLDYVTRYPSLRYRRALVSRLREP